MKPELDRQQAAEACIRKNALLASVAGLIPVPVADVAGVSAVQVKMINELAQIHEVTVDQGVVKSLVMTMLGATLTQSLFQWAASLVKSLPGPGTVVGETVQALISVSTTYGIGVAASFYFEQECQVSDEVLKDRFVKGVEEGKAFAKNQGALITREFKQELEDLRADLASNLSRDEDFVQRFKQAFMTFAGMAHETQELRKDLQQMLKESQRREGKEI